MPASKSAFKQQAWLAAALLCSASMCVYWTRLPHESAIVPTASGAARAKPLTDLFQVWYASRELLLHHRDPYGPEVTREIQVAFFGDKLPATDGTDGTGQQQFAFAYRFAYPLYVVLIFAPTIGMNLRTAQIAVWWFLAATTGLSVLLWLRAFKVRAPFPRFVGLCAIVLTSLPVMQGLELRQPGLLVAALIAVAVASAVRGHLFLAGAMLALATIKPQLALLPIAWFALWTWSDWQRRRSFLWGFALMLAALLLTSEFLLPTWPSQFAAALTDYARYTGGASLVQMILPVGLSWLVLLCGAGLTATVCWFARKSSADSDSFILALTTVLSLSVLIMPTVNALYNQILLLPAALLLVKHWSRLWNGNFVVRTTSAVLATVALLPWFLVLILTPAWITAPKLWGSALLAPAYIGFGLPFATFGLMLLLCKKLLAGPSGSLWRRWWGEPRNSEEQI
jgi:hypothetical protein